MNVLADGLGLNSMALTLSLVAADKGLVISLGGAGPVGGERVSGAGMGVGICILFKPFLYCGGLG